MKNIVLFLITVIVSLPLMSQDNPQDMLIQIEKSSYYKDSKYIYFVVTNHLSNAPFFFLSDRPVISLADINNTGKVVDLGVFNKLGIIVTAEEFEKKYRRSGRNYNPITTKFDTHSTFAIKLPSVTIESLKNFKLLSKHYASIGDRTFLHYDELKGVDTATFQLIDMGYPDAEIFCYSKDKKSVFYYNHKIIGADVLSFEGINETYSYDKNSVIFKGVVIDNSDMKSFAMMGNYQGDDNHVWFEGKLLDNIDKETFRVLFKDSIIHNPYFYSNHTDYAIDKGFVFYQGNRILKADPETFKIFLSKSNVTYGIDNTHVYSNGEIIKDVNPENFKEQFINEKLK